LACRDKELKRKAAVSNLRPGQKKSGSSVDRKWSKKKLLKKIRNSFRFSLFFVGSCSTHFWNCWCLLVKPTFIILLNY